MCIALYTASVHAQAPGAANMTKGAIAGKMANMTKGAANVTKVLVACYKMETYPYKFFVLSFFVYNDNISILCALCVL